LGESRPAWISLHLKGWLTPHSEFFRVAFYGNRFPLSVSGKQFVHRGAALEKLGAFIEKMLNKHPGAQLLKTSAIPPEDVQFADGQFLQITSVTPEPDPSSPMFSNPDIPQAIRAYYQHNETHTFSFTRPVSKDPAGRTRITNDFTSLWTEKTVRLGLLSNWSAVADASFLQVLICEDSFPTVLRRSEVVEIRIIDISPSASSVSVLTRRD
jgi:dedicator of cytokinesis protein 3